MCRQWQDAVVKVNWWRSEIVKVILRKLLVASLRTMGILFECWLLVLCLKLSLFQSIRTWNWRLVFVHEITTKKKKKGGYCKRRYSLTIVILNEARRWLLQQQPPSAFKCEKFVFGKSKFFWSRYVVNSIDICCLKNVKKDIGNEYWSPVIISKGEYTHCSLLKKCIHLSSCPSHCVHLWT